MNNMSKKQEIIGLIDADLLDNGTRHPNLVIGIVRLTPIIVAFA